LGHWVIGLSEKHLHRIYDALKLRLRTQPLIYGDETTVPVLKEKDKEAPAARTCGLSQREGRLSAKPGQIHPRAFLGDYRGIVMSDGYTAWRTLEGATHIGCMAHSGGRFVEALKARKKGSGPPERALRFFDQLYWVERQARDEKPEKGAQADCIRRSASNTAFPP
jgi:hypothetical protein